MSVLSNGYLLALAGGIKPPVDFNTEFLVIGGGGQHLETILSARGGGGAGGYISSISGESSGGGSSAVNTVGLTTDETTYSVTVGAAGSNSTFSGTTTASVSFTHTALAGGAGGASGGSGGGGNTPGSGGAGTANQGYAGGDGFRYHPSCVTSGNECLSVCLTTGPGAGGGAGGAGSGRDGGDGVQSSVTGTPTYYAGGGAASTICGSNQNVGTAGQGQANYGGGGTLGAAGQDGVVILKYPTTVTISNSGGGLTMSTSVVSGNNVTVITAGTGSIEFTPA